MRRGLVIAAVVCGLGVFSADNVANAYPRGGWGGGHFHGYNNFNGFNSGAINPGWGHSTRFGGGFHNPNGFHNRGFGGRFHNPHGFHNRGFRGGFHNPHGFRTGFRPGFGRPVYGSGVGVNISRPGFSISFGSGGGW
jgi:hypothetical protein